MNAIRRTEISTRDTLGIVFQPEAGSDHFVVMLGGSGGGFAEGPARRLAEYGFTAFALGYHGAPGLARDLVEIPLETLRAGIELFRDRYSAGRSVGLMGTSKGAELALLLGAHLGDTIGSVVAVAPSHVAWFGLKSAEERDRRSDRSSWSWNGAPLPFLPSTGVAPIFNERGLRTDAFFDLSGHSEREVDAARIKVELSAGPILLFSGDDDHQWPAAPMAAEVVQRMERHGRAAGVTSVVYPNAGHAFLIKDFIAPPGSANAPPFDFGGTAEADEAAGQDCWSRAVAFLKTAPTAAQTH